MDTWVCIAATTIKMISQYRGRVFVFEWKDEYFFMYANSSFTLIFMNIAVEVLNFHIKKLKCKKSAFIN
jgi:hypothetical protein